MELKLIAREDAEALCKRTESHYFDRKRIELSPSKLEKTVVAFANSDGGEVVLGISDEIDIANPLGSWSGAEDQEEFNSHVQSIFRLQPTIPVSVRFMACEGLSGILLSILVEKSNHVHKTSADEIYIRWNASSNKVTEESKIRELEYSKGISSYEDNLVHAVQAEELIESSQINEFLKGFSPKTDALNYCINEHLLDRKHWTPKYAGVLLFHVNPAAALPSKCSVKITRYETNEDDPERENLRFTDTFEGPLYSLITSSLNRISEILSEVNVYTKDGYKRVSYPSEAVWELFVNAIIHRDYSISDDVHVLIFDNRIEIKSPGKLPGWVTVDNIKNSRFTRNTKIVRTLARYSNPPNKDIGEGIKTALQKMKDWKLQEPTFQVDGSYLVVTIPHAPLARAEDLIQEFLSKNAQISNWQAREICGIRDTNKMKMVFYKMRDADIIEPVPELKGSKSAWKLRPK